MLITRNLLKEAIREKKHLFHNGDEIDDEVLYDLFIGYPIKRIHPQTKKEYDSIYKKEELSTLCSELMSDPKTKKYDKIRCYLTCSFCGEKVVFYLTKGQILNRSFSYKSAMNSLNLDYKGEENQLDLCYEHIIELYYKDKHDLLICNSCISSVKTKISNEARAFLKREDRFEWIKENYKSKDWKNMLISSIGGKHLKSGTVVTYITTKDGQKYTNKDFTEEQKRELEEIEIREAKKREEQKHKQELQKILEEKLVATEEERLKTKMKNEQFLARLQKNTATQRYINKFCDINSDVDITDPQNINEALRSEDVIYEDVQKYNSKLYRDYLQSPLWKIISSKVKWNAHYKCERCGSKTHLQVHHKSYDTKGVEFLAFHELECLCAECHKKEHQE